MMNYTEKNEMYIRTLIACGRLGPLHSSIISRISEHDVDLRKHCNIINNMYDIKNDNTFKNAFNLLANVLLRKSEESNTEEFVQEFERFMNCYKKVNDTDSIYNFYMDIKDELDKPVNGLGILKVKKLLEDWNYNIGGKKEVINIKNKKASNGSGLPYISINNEDIIGIIIRNEVEEYIKASDFFEYAKFLRYIINNPSDYDLALYAYNDFEDDILYSYFVQLDNITNKEFMMLMLIGEYSDRKKNDEEYCDYICRSNINIVKIMRVLHKHIYLDSEHFDFSILLRVCYEILFMLSYAINNTKEAEGYIDKIAELLSNTKVTHKIWYNYEIRKDMDAMIGFMNIEDFISMLLK